MGGGGAVKPPPKQGCSETGVQIFLVVKITGAASGILRIGLIDVQDVRMLAADGHNKELLCSNANSICTGKHQLSSTQLHQGPFISHAAQPLTCEGGKVAASAVDPTAVAEGKRETAFSLALSWGKKFFFSPKLPLRLPAHLLTGSLGRS